MAKKRKAGGQSRAQEPSENPANKRVRMNVNSYEDVAGSDDEFHINRDRMLLDEGADAKRRRKYAEQEEFLEPSDEEVLAYSDDEVDDDDAADVDDNASSRPQKRGASLSGSEGADDAAEEDDLGRWGTTKQDYYGADEMETEQDALDEEAEARRIQQKRLQGMTAADYGFDEDEWQDDKAQAEADRDGDERAVVTEVLPQLQIAESMSPAERLKLLKSRYPEFEPLSKDLLELQDEAQELAFEAARAEEYLQKRRGTAGQVVPVALTKHRAAAAYQAMLSMYFALLTSTAKDSAPDAVALSANVLRDHPVMDSLLKCREMWLKVRAMPSDVIDDEESADDMGDEELDNKVAEQDTVAIAQPKRRRSRKSKAEKAAAAAAAASSARRAARMRATEADLMDLDNLLTQPQASTKKTSTSTKSSLLAAPGTVDNDASDLGSETELTAHEAAEKARKKKSLRFYTSQIAQKAAKRGAAGRGAGGDDDVPHRERLRDRQARLLAEAAKKGRKEAREGEALGGESDEEDRQVARAVRGEGGDEDYYDLVASRTAAKKDEKAALAEAQRLAAEQGGRVIVEEVVGADGKRGITYAIAKNKGLTPHRKKDVRNPRVKKRRKFEEKKKKLASMKPVYKGGEGRGGYKGELTGIKTGIVRSRKLG